jgi:hypothetical protein
MARIQAIAIPMIGDNGGKYLLLDIPHLPVDGDEINIVTAEGAPYGVTALGIEFQPFNAGFQFQLALSAPPFDFVVNDGGPEEQFDLNDPALQVYTVNSDE